MNFNRSKDGEELYQPRSTKSVLYTARILKTTLLENGKNGRKTNCKCNISAQNFESVHFNFLGYSKVSPNLNALQEQNIAFK